MSITKKLNELEKSLRHKNLLTFRFGGDRKHDYSLIDWFCKNGEIKIYRVGLRIKPSFAVNLVTKNMKLHIGYIYSGCVERNGDQKCNWQNEYVRRAWEKKKNFHYCTNNLLRTPKEVVESFRGDISYMFSNSKETNSSIIKNRAIVYSILNFLTPVKLK